MDRTSRTCSGGRAKSSTSSARGEAGRHPDRAADQVQTDDQPQDRQGARLRRAAKPTRPRRRGDRMNRRAFIVWLGSAPAWPRTARLGNVQHSLEFGANVMRKLALVIALMAGLNTQSFAQKA